MMRIISGRARGTKLNTLEGENTRPTLERAKEALFSMIQNDIANAYVLDLFSGSGQLALEALSRGAREADLVDSFTDAVKVIESNVKKTHFECQAHIIKRDFKAFLASSKKEYDLVFLDPPYAKGILLPALEMLVQNGLISGNATVVCEISSSDAESEAEITEFCKDRFEVRKNNRYAGSRIIILDYAVSCEGEAR